MSQHMINGRNRGRRIILLVLLLGALAIIYAFYVWNKPHRDVRQESVTQVAASHLFELYAKDEQAANTQFLNKALQVNGEVASVSANQEGATVIMLKSSDPMFGVQCTMRQKTKVEVGSLVNIKGICTGYLMDVVLVDCFIVQ